MKKTHFTLTLLITVMFFAVIYQTSANKTFSLLSQPEPWYGEMWLNGQSIEFDAELPAVVINDRVYVPVRATFEENLGMDVEWRDDGNREFVVITDSDEKRFFEDYMMLSHPDRFEIVDIAHETTNSGEQCMLARCYIEENDLNSLRQWLADAYYEEYELSDAAFERYLEETDASWKPWMQAETNGKLIAWYSTTASGIYGKTALRSAVIFAHNGGGYVVYFE